MAGLINLRLLTDFFNKIGQSRRLGLSWHVGFTPDFGRIAARQRTDASGQKATLAS